MTSKLADKILSKAMEPDERAKQKLIGASQVGGCPRCLGYALMGKEKPTKTMKWLVPAKKILEGLAAWIGTAVHYYLEKHIIPFVVAEDDSIIAEERVEIYELEGYGTIKGNIDVHDNFEILDWKIVGDWSWNKMLMDRVENPDRIPRKQYRVQQHLYAYGLRKKGYEIEKVSLVVFKKTSNSWEDVEVFSEDYNQNVVDAALQNLEEIYRLAKQGRFEELPEDEECYNCSRGF